MIIKLTEQEGCVIAGFADLKRFTLATSEDVKAELKPILNQKGIKLIFSLKGIEFVDSSGIGCIISLVKTAKSSGSNLRVCDLSEQVKDVCSLLHLQLVLDIDENISDSLKHFSGF